VVSIQYRLSIFGFQSFDNHTNNGLRDQQLALQWVQDNIGVFGGDKSAITIFGESAGASSVLYHLIMPGSYHFYQRAILESTWQWIIPTIEASRQNTATWAAKKGCNNVTAQGTIFFFSFSFLFLEISLTISLVFVFDFVCIFAFFFAFVSIFLVCIYLICR
jgi:carboxylesterase type B